MLIRKTPTACLAFVLAAACGTGLYAQASQAKPQDAKASTEQQELTALSQMVDGVASGQPAPSDVKVSWLEDHQIRSQGDTVYVPFSFGVDRTQLTAPQASVYVRVVKKSTVGTSAIQLPGTRAVHPWERNYVVDMPADGKVSRALALTPGAYEVFVAVKEKGGAGKTGLVRRDLTVPTLTGMELTTSSVILARAIDSLTTPLAPDKQEENPFVFGTLKVTPSTDHVFAKTMDLQVLFWIYNASQTAGKPDVQVDINFHAKQPDGTEKYFNKMQPKLMNKDTLPPEFNLTQGHQLLSSLGIPLSSFPAGEYRLEIKVTDKPSGKEVTRNVNFQVSA